MKPEYFGLDISDHSIELVALSRKGTQTMLESCVRLELPEGVVQRGIIRDRGRLIAVLRELLDKSFGERRGRLVAGIALPEVQIYAKLFRLPANLDETMANQASALEAQKLFPISLNAAVQSATVVERNQDFQEVFFAAVDRNLADDYQSVLEEVGVTPAFFDSESMSIVRSLVEAKEEGAVLVADIGAKTTILSLYDDGRLKAGFGLDIGGDRLTAVLREKLKLSAVEAEAVKRLSGLNPEARDGRALLILQEPVADIIAEIRRTMEYGQRLLGRPVRKIVLAGGTSLMPGLPGYIALNFVGVSVVRGEPFRDINLAALANSEEFKKNSVLYATAVGLALRAIGLRTAPGLNLLPSGQAASSSAAVADFARSIGASIISMVKRTKSPHKAKGHQPDPTEGVGGVLPPAADAGAEPSEVGHPKPVRHRAAKAHPAEPPKPILSIAADEPASVPAVPPARPAEPPPAIAPPAEPPPPAPEPSKAAPPVKALEPEPAAWPALGVDELEDEAKTDGVDDGQGVGDLLDQELQTESDAPQPKPVTEEAHHDADGHEHISIESIIAGKRLPKKLVVPEPAKPEEPPHQENGRATSVLPLMITVLVLILATAAGVFFLAKKTGLDMSRLWPTMVERVQTTNAPQAGSTDGPKPVTPVAEQTGVPTSVNVAVTLGVTDRPAAAKPFLKTRVIETDVTGSNTFRSTGVGTGTAGKSVGKVTIINTTPRSYTFVATTRVLSKDGVLFRLNKATPIPASGSVETDVTADKPGPAGDIGPTEFTIPGLSAEQQKLITAKSDAPMTGGSSKQQVVTADDISKAKNVLFEKLKAEAGDNFKAMITKDEVVVPELITSTETKLDAPTAGKAMTSFTVKVTLRFRALLVPEPKVRELLRDRLTKVLPADAKPGDYEVGALQYGVDAYDTSASLAEIRAEAPLTKL